MDAPAERLGPENDFRSTLFRLRDELIRSRTDSSGYAAIVIPNAEWARLAISEQSIAIIIAHSFDQRRYNIDLQRLRINFDLSVMVHDGGTSSYERVAILETKGVDPDLQNGFLEVMAMVLPSVDDPNDQNIGKVLNDMVELFQLISGESRKSVVGLWGELFVIYQSSNPETAVLNWHSANNDRYDFSSEDIRAEIKTSTSIRAHYFSYEQLVPWSQLQVFVGSILTEASSDGKSCADLLRHISEKLESSAAKLHLIKKATATLGKNWAADSKIGFSDDLAQQSLKWYQADAIPQVTSSPDGVSEIKFKSDLQIAVNMLEQDFGQAGMLTKALVRQVGL